VEALESVAIAKVETELNLWRYAAADAQQPLEDSGPDVLEPGRKSAFQHSELEVRIPLNSELVGGNRLDDLVQFGQHPSLVGFLDGLLIGERNKGADRCQRGRQRDLEASSGRDHAIALEAGEVTK
jgi:hypothetical protein